MTTHLERELGRGSDLLTSAIARAAALERARERCRGVLVPARVWRRADGVVAAAFAAAPGESLAEARASRLLSIGECVTIGVGAANALAAMHAERVAHGDVSAANVIAHKRAVLLVDTMGALGEERGTPGFASPDRLRGATPAGDVFALGMLLRSIADAEASPAIEAWTAPLIAEDASQRPTAAHAAAALARCARAAPVAPSRSPVVAAIRAGGMERTVKRAEDRWWRAERAALRLSPLMVLAVVAAVTGAALVPSVASAPDHLSSPPRVEAPASVPIAAAALQRPQEAAVALAERRVDALARADGDALAALSVPGSDAAAADAATVSALADGSLQFDGLALLNATAQLRSMTPGGAIVEVTSALSGYGVGPNKVAAGEATALLELRLTQKGWLVERILPPP